MEIPRFHDICLQIGLSTEICKGYEKLGIKQLYDWQYDCLFNSNILRHGNLIYCAPTSGGKTLVVELILLRTVIKLQKKVIFILPYISLVLEKEKHFKELLVLYNRNQLKKDRIRVKGYYGHTSVFKTIFKENIIICTIEKVNHLVNNLITHGHASKLGCIAIDEMHVLGDPQRGYLLEILISKIRFLEQKAKKYDENIRSNININNKYQQKTANIHIQLIGLSATMGNIHDLASWFDAELYRTAYRPVPLTEYIKAGNLLLLPDNTVVKELNSNNTVNVNNNKSNKSISNLNTDPDHIVTLTAEGLFKKQQMLIFCSSRILCEVTCKLLYEQLPPYISPSSLPSASLPSSFQRPVIVPTAIIKDRSGVEVQVEVENDRILQSRKDVVTKILEGNPSASLSDSERVLIEDAYKNNIINILTATSTLAAGVNLPAGRVLIRSMNIGADTLGTVQYRQMCGRAGRAGHTSFGESFLLVKSSERTQAIALSNAPMPCVCSQMHPALDGGRGMLKALLELYMLGVCTTAGDALEYMRYTLMFNETSKTKTTTQSPAMAMTSSETSSTSTSTSSSVEEQSNILEIGSAALNFLLNAKALDHCLSHPSPNHTNHPSCSTSTTSTTAIKSSLNNTITTNTTTTSGTLDPLLLLHPIRISRFGRAVSDSGMNPDEAIALYDDLLRAQDSLNLETDLHLVYLITPLQHNMKPNFNKMWDLLEQSKQKKTPLCSVFAAIGIDESSLFQWFRRPPPPDAVSLCSDKLRLMRIQLQNIHYKNNNSMKNDMTTTGTTTTNSNTTKINGLTEFEWTVLHRCRRLWAASALHALVEGQPPVLVAKSFGISLGDIQSLHMSSKLTAQRVHRFCGEIGWPPMEKLIEIIKKRLDIDIPEGYKDLLRLPLITPKVAQILFENGIETLSTLIKCSIDKIAQLLQLKMTFEVKDLQMIERVQARVDAALPPDINSRDPLERDPSERDPLGKDSSESYPDTNEEQVPDPDPDPLPLLDDKSNSGKDEEEEGNALLKRRQLLSRGSSLAEDSTTMMSLSRDEMIRKRMLALACTIINAAKEYIEHEENRLVDRLTALTEIVAAKTGETSGGDDVSLDSNEDDEDEDDGEYSDNEEEEEEEEDGMRTGFTGAQIPWMSRSPGTSSGHKDATIFVSEKVNGDCDDSGNDGGIMEIDSATTTTYRITETDTDEKNSRNIVHNITIPSNDIEPCPMVPSLDLKNAVESGAVTIAGAAELAVKMLHTSVKPRDFVSTTNCIDNNQTNERMEISSTHSAYININNSISNSISIAIGELNNNTNNNAKDNHTPRHSTELLTITNTSSTATVVYSTPIPISKKSHHSFVDGDYVSSSNMYSTPLPHHIPPPPVCRDHQVLCDVYQTPKQMAIQSVVQPSQSDQPRTSGNVFATPSGPQTKSSIFCQHQHSSSVVMEGIAMTSITTNVNANQAPAYRQLDDTMVVVMEKGKGEAVFSTRASAETTSTTPAGKRAKFSTAFESAIDVTTDALPITTAAAAAPSHMTSDTSIKTPTCEYGEVHVMEQDSDNNNNVHDHKYDNNDDDDDDIINLILDKEDDSNENILNSNPNNNIDDGEKKQPLLTQHESLSSESLSKSYLSFLTPFTPSKVMDFIGASDVCLSSKAFGWRHLSDPSHCERFLQQLHTARCVSFELLYRDIPCVATSDLFKIRNLWSPFIASKIGCNSNSNNNSSGRNGSLSNNSQAIVGISFCFGDEYGYYLPLPSLLPIPSFRIPNINTTTNKENESYKSSNNSHPSSSSLLLTSVPSTLSLQQLPSKCIILISRYIGFENILIKCVRLHQQVLTKHNKNKINMNSIITPPNIQNFCSNSNPLLTASKTLCIESRRALQQQWRVGNVAEWRIVEDIFSNKSITKVSLHIKNKLISLRERDIITCGPLQDPTVALELLQGLKDIPNISDTLRIPTITTTTTSTSTNTHTNTTTNSSHVSNIQSVCYHAIAIMRAMNCITPSLHKYSAWNLFANIEMPLCICISSMEFSGMPADTRFFTQLRQDLGDRQKTIEHYFSLIESKDFNISSLSHCEQLKKKIIQETIHNIQEKYQNNNILFKSDSITLGNSLDVSKHPLIRLISEWRSHARMIPLCASILTAKYRFHNTVMDRIRGTFNALAAETGRLSVTSPALQQVPHECLYWQTLRPSLHEEIESHRNQYGNVDMLVKAIQNKVLKGESEWVRTVSLQSLRNQNDIIKDAALSQDAISWKLMSICSYTINCGYSNSIPKSNLNLHSVSTYTASQYQSQTQTQTSSQCTQMMHVHIPTTAPRNIAPALAAAAAAVVAVGIGGSDNSGVRRNGVYGSDDAGDVCNQSLVDLWRQAGVSYSHTDAEKILQVQVDFGGHMYHYPADQVYRLLAPLRPCPEEITAINQALAAPPLEWPLTEREFIGNTNANTLRTPDVVRCINPRDGFHASKGFVLLSADYGQIELRIMAHLSKDPGLLEAFHRGQDVFLSIASNWLGKLEKDVIESERNAVKQLCYALLYGAGPNRIAEQSGCTVEKAKTMLTEFLSRHAGLTRLMSSIRQGCRRNGFVETLLGRRRYLSDINSNDQKKRSRAERQAVNTVCQGSAADLIKLAMINIHYKLLEDSISNPSTHSIPSGTSSSSKMPTTLCPGGGLYHALDDVRLILQIHDELLFEVPDDRVHQVADIVRECMEGAVELNVPLLVKIKVGTRWGHLRTLDQNKSASGLPTARSMFRDEDK
eukprot:gene427-765_t